MKNFLNDTWNDFNQQAKDKKIYLFGYNGAVKLINEMDKFGNPWNVVAIVNNDKSTYGYVIINSKKYPVCSPDYINTEMQKGVVLICSTYTMEISNQLEKMRIYNYFSELWMNYSYKLKKNIVSENLDHKKIEIAKSCLCDVTSKKLLDEIVSKRRKGERDYTDLIYRGESEYFIDELWKPFPDGVFIDGGAYNGDTIEEIAFWTKNKFKKIYSFEPQRSLAEYIKEKVLWRYEDRVIFQNKGLWSSAVTLYFEDGDNNVSGRISENATSKISTCCIDEVVDEKVSFIKMDIEGAEVEALKGAQVTIKRDKPYMAICIYHRQTDLWEIPILVHEIVPEYKLYIKHCGASKNGTILYAKI